ncbi:RagB/SusD family nutrient uptake outer membrane protein [Yeosuana marina]|uniref:RagB/SusD family nutrient uptake outer membrane protein n=1 Tax=Yeosuana marina TaxID=1565536 RepID=UPI0030EF0DA4|tara:strand:+ start:631 stop:2094 length:1464 start_codon:yes stop_codon:yes gene_type:complete
MKNYNYTLPIKYVLLFLTFIFISCEDIVEEDPKGLLSSSNFWNNEVNAIGAINAVYTKPLEMPAAVHGWNFWFESAGGDFGCLDTHGTGMANGTWSVSINRVYNMWSASYEPISLANFVLSNIKTATNIDPNLQLRIEGEASFLRAFHYFNLVRNFGDVPLILKQTEGDDDFLVTRTPVSQVYDAIISDLTLAIDQLPLKSEYSEEDLGRASKGAAQAMLAKVYLTLGDYQKTVDLTNEVMLSSVYSLEPDFKDIFTAERDNGSEWLFSYATSGESEFSTHQLAQFGFPNNLGKFGFTRAFGNIWVKQPLLDIYDQVNDTRFTDMIWKEYVDPITGEVVAFRKGTGYYSKKYDDIEFSKDMLFTRINYPILRYSDVLLMYAEALNEVSPLNDDAFNKLNMVRNRANLGDITIAELDSQQAFTNEVLDERRREFVNENQRVFDLKRRGLFLDFVQQLPYSQFSEEDVLYPIPQAEIDANPNLTQNPGY